MIYRIHTCGHVIPDGSPTEWELSICVECHAKRMAALDAIGYVEIPRKPKREPTSATCSVCAKVYGTVYAAGQCCQTEKMFRRTAGAEAMRGKLKDGIVRRKWNGGS